jgi:hypothetical protein
LHIDGISYELPFEVESPQNSALQSVRDQITRLNGPNGHAQTFQVAFQGGHGSIVSRRKDAPLRWAYELLVA